MLALIPLVIVVGFSGELLLELVYRAAGLVDEVPQVSGYLRELAGAEDQQKEQSDDDYLLGADTEHALNITPGGRPYNERSGPALYSTHERTDE
jgi:hypothetical protein